MSAWYIAMEGEQQGPFEETQIREMITENRDALVWREGFESWQPASMIFAPQPALAEVGGDEAVPGSGLTAGPLPAQSTQISDPVIASSGEMSQADMEASRETPPISENLDQTAEKTLMGSDVIDFQIFGEDSQYVVIMLDPGEAVIADSGAMMFKSAAIDLNTIMGDGQNQSQEILGKLFKAGKRVLSGENLFMSAFTNNGSRRERIAFAGPAPGKIIPLDLAALGGELICQKNAYLCAAHGVEIDIFFQKRILSGLFGGEGFIMQRLKGDGMGFLHSGGAIEERMLEEGEVLHVDTGCLVAMQPRVEFEITTVGGVKSMLLNEEGVFFAKLTGPGKVWIQSLPLSRFKMYLTASSA